MTPTGLNRILIALAGVMGACGVALAAAVAHQSDTTRLASASSMLLFHAPVVLTALLLAERGMIRVQLGFMAAFGFVVAAALFASDLALRQYAGRSLFPMAGTLLILSWLVLAISAIRPSRI